LGAELDLPTVLLDSGRRAAGVATNAKSRLLAVLFFGCLLVFPSLFVFVALDPGAESAEGLEVIVLATGLPPVFAAEPRDPTPAIYGVRVNFTAIVRDPDGDALTVTWDWGDGTSNQTTTGPAGSNTIIRNGHVYTPPINPGMGDYLENLTMTITLNDGNGNNVSCTTLVSVLMPTNGYPARPSLQLNGTIPDAKIDPSAVVYAVANTSDPEGEALTWTYVFTNGTGVVYRIEVLTTPITAPNENVWVNISHSFGTVGQHQIDIYVTDVLDEEFQDYPHNRSATAFANVVVNKLPNVGASINIDPQEPIVNATIGYKLVTYSIEASDPDADVLTVIWDFDDGLPEVVNTSAGGTGTYKFTQIRNYTEAGIFNVTLVATDGREGHEVYRYRVVNVSSTNRPPRIVAFRAIDLSLGSYGQPNETIRFELIISDPEKDAIEVILDWGDGSDPITFVMSEYVGANTSMILNHSYARRGNFTIKLNYTDNKIGMFTHNKNYSLTLELREPGIIIIEGWSWWDYTSLGLLGLIPVGLAIWIVIARKHRRKLEDEGLTIDEWRLLQDKTVAEVIEKESEK